MDKEMLEALSNLLDEKLKPIHSDIKDLKLGQSELKNDVKDIKKTILEMKSVNANRHIELMNTIVEIKDEINNIEFITACNLKDIVKLKAVK